MRVKQNCINCTHYRDEDDTCYKESYPEDAENPEEEKKCFDIHPWIAKSHYEELEARLKECEEIVDYYRKNTLVAAKCGEFVNGEFASSEEWGFMVTGKKAEEYQAKWINKEGVK